MVGIHRADNKYEVPIQMVRTQNEPEKALEQIVNLGIQQSLNLAFNDWPLRKLLRDGGLSVNRYDDIIASYRRLQDQMMEIDPDDASQASVELARYIIDVIGCRALAQIVPLKVDGNDSAAAFKAYNEWKIKVIEQLGMYANIEDEALKKRIPRELVIYMAKIQREPAYMKALSLMAG